MEVCFAWSALLGVGATGWEGERLGLGAVVVIADVLASSRHRDLEYVLRDRKMRMLRQFDEASAKKHMLH